MLELNYTLRVNTDTVIVLNAAQLWTGLMLRVIEPTRFVIGLDHAEVEQTSTTTYTRRLFFGEQIIVDTVLLTPESAVHFTTEASGGVPSGQLNYRIEQHSETELLLHCHYATDFPEAANGEELQLFEMIKQVYRSADDDMLRIIRQNAQSMKY